MERKFTAADLAQRLAFHMRRLRTAAGASQSDAATSAGMTLRHWQRLEGAEASASLGMVVRIANGLGVDAGELLGPIPSKPGRRPRG